MTGLERVTHGVWRPAAHVVELAGRCAALLRALPDGSVIAGRAAAVLLGLWLPDVPLSRIDVIVRRDRFEPRDLPGSRRAEVRARRRRLRPDEICEVLGLPVTTPERTWVDLAPELAPPDLVAAGDSVLRSGVTPAGLAQAVVRARGRRGVRAARAIFALLDSRSRSRAESHLRYAIVADGLPHPEVNVAILNAHGEWLAEPDLVYRQAQVALEYNGADHANVKRMRKDITRELDTFLGEWETHVFGPAEVFGRPWQIGPFVRTVLVRRAPDYLREWRESQRMVRNIAPLAR